MVHFPSPRGRIASNSELRRWIEDGALEVDGKKVKPNEELNFPIQSVVLFGAGRKITLW